MQHALLWKGMPMLWPGPEEVVPSAVKAVEPKWGPYDKLTKPQRVRYDEMSAIVETASYVFYWAQRGWMPELETEIHD